MEVQGKSYRTVWAEQGRLRIIDQTLLPHRFAVLDLDSVQATARAIRRMQVRGAGAIGATAAYGLAQAALAAPAAGFDRAIQEARSTIATTRPTARNLFYGLERVWEALSGCGSLEAARRAAADAARAVADEDARACERIGELGADLIRDGQRIGTHCNAGWLAFVDWGTALSPIYKARRRGMKLFVWVDETRPLCQGARLTAWELGEESVEHRIIVDGAAGHLMRTRRIDLVIVGADRIAANGDVANKIGTYASAVLARENGVPFYVAAPTSTIDFECPTGDAIPIEEREAEEVLHAFGEARDGQRLSVRLAPAGAAAANPAFDVTPAALITGIITEQGVYRPQDLSLIPRSGGRASAGGAEGREETV
jgi:S-methyl-5-thioribose-1-phosphate isomerase